MALNQRQLLILRAWYVSKDAAALLIAAADAAAGNEATGLAATLPASDAGTGAESTAVAVVAPASDAATGSESTALSAELQQRPEQP